MGYSINVLSLFAMVLAIGILVDDAIVVVENVERVMHDDKLDPKAATHKAMRQIISAIIGITVVLSAVFIPMAFFGGSVGAIYREFAVTLVMTMAFSALLALTLTPALTATLLKPIDHDTERKGFLARFERGFQSVTNGYMRGVGGVLKRPIRIFLVYLVLVAAAALVFLRLPGGFLPDEDQGYFISIMQLPPGAHPGNARWKCWGMLKTICWKKTKWLVWSVSLVSVFLDVVRIRPLPSPISRPGMTAPGRTPMPSPWWHKPIKAFLVIPMR